MTTSMSNRFNATLAAAVVAMTLAPTCLVASSVAEPSDTEDLFYLAKDRLVILRMHIRVDGKSFTTIWNEYVDSVLVDLDKDGDGVLSKQEQFQLPKQSEFLQAGIIVRRRSSAIRPRPADRNRDGKVSRRELGEYFRGIGLRPFSTQLSNANSSQNVRTRRGRRRPIQGSELFGLLDTNSDAKLSMDEVKSAVKSLHKSDLDDDETISLAEIQPLQNPFVGARTSRRQISTEQPSFTSLSATGSARQLVSQLLDRYDRTLSSAGTPGKDGNLSRQELGIERESFEPFDNDENRLLDFDELVQLVRRPSAAVEFVVRLGKHNPNEQPVKLVSSAKKLHADIRTSSGGLITVILGKTQIEIGVNRQWSQGNLQSTYKSQFTAADTDNNAYLEQKEVERTPYFRNTFQLMDRDGNGKVFEEEMLAFVNRISAAASSGTVLNISDAGRNLFEILDLNRDRRLGRRELKEAVARMELWDTDGDKHVAEIELPTHFRLTLTRTQAGGDVLDQQLPVSSGYAASARLNSSVGPLWFRKMDRNQDGDISRREFVGTRKKFQELDKNNDGLIDPGESSLAR